MGQERNNAAVGFATFAGVMLAVGGFFHFVAGLVGVFDDEFYVVGREWIFEFDTTTWGWIHVLAGLVLLASGIFIFSGNVAARTVGVAVAAVSAIANFAWLPYQPVWSTLMIALAVAVIWALTAHGRDIVGT